MGHTVLSLLSRGRLKCQIKGNTSTTTLNDGLYRHIGIEETVDPIEMYADLQKM